MGENYNSMGPKCWCYKFTQRQSRAHQNILIAAQLKLSALFPESTQDQVVVQLYYFMLSLTANCKNPSHGTLTLWSRSFLHSVRRSPKLTHTAAHCCTQLHVHAWPTVHALASTMTHLSTMACPAQAPRQPFRCNIISNNLIPVLSAPRHRKPR